MKKTSAPESEAHEGPRKLLIEAAKKLFAKNGFDGTTVRELADEAGVNFALVSYYFESKEGLYRAVIKEFGQEKLAAAQRLLQPPNTIEEFRIRLQMFIEEMMISHIQEPDLTRVIHRECEMAAPITPDIFRQTFMKVFQTLVEFVALSQNQNIIRRDLEPLMMAKILFSGLMHTLRTDELSKKYFQTSIEDPEFRKKFSDNLLELFIKGCQK